MTGRDARRVPGRSFVRICSGAAKVTGGEGPLTHLLELLDLVARWVHVIAGIMWIGNSLLFNWLDRNLRPSIARRSAEVYGDIWLLHSGGFYFVEKTSLAGAADAARRCTGSSGRRTRRG